MGSRVSRKHLKSSASEQSVNFLSLVIHIMAGFKRLTLTPVLRSLGLRVRKALRLSFVSRENSAAICTLFPSSVNAPFLCAIVGVSESRHLSVLVTRDLDCDNSYDILYGPSAVLAGT
mgnify:CR=1 FL=1